MNTFWAETCRQVVEQAHGRCAYCRMHQSLQGATFHVEHVAPQSTGGSDAIDNLCLACPSCNLHKSNRSFAVDPQTHSSVALFHPRQQVWDEHFAWWAFLIVGRTAVGRATIEELQMNADRRVRIREAEQLFGLFPPVG